jgi:glyoxylase-like metal-dependent hydrolase (beta-lactamase superfamily II)
MGVHQSAVTFAVVALMSGVAAAKPAATPAAPTSLRLYVFDCGLLDIAAATVPRYHVTAEEVGERRMSVPCFLIAHPRGTMMWDLGVTPDDIVEARARGENIPHPNATAVVTRTLRSQLAQIGYAVSDIDYVAMSHAHNDHSANLNSFIASTWLSRPAERTFMFAEGNTRVVPSFYNRMKDSMKVVAIEKDEYDVFGDGQVVLKSAPGHTPGHQVLMLRLAREGRVMLSGDLYHYPAERTKHSAPPDNEFDVAQSAASRVSIEQYLEKTKTRLWIEHDYRANLALKKSPAYYE